MAAKGPATRRGPLRETALLLSNLFLGIALGLLAYSGITNLTADAEQRALAAENPQVQQREVLPESSETTANPLDFGDWENQDAAYWEELPDGGAFGRIVIKKMELDSVVVKGVSTADLKKGPGWIDYTDVPGPDGNCGISGHRTTYGAPFRQLDELEPGDEIVFFSPYRRYTYRVTKKFSVTPDRTDVVDHTENPQLTLTACHPPYSARLRLIVQSDLVEVRRLSP